MTTFEKSVENVKKRSRVTRACDICRRKKIKCDIDKKQPCSSCEQYHSLCSFSPNPTNQYNGPKGYIESLEIRLRKMEHLLKEVNSNEANSEDAIHSESSESSVEENENQGRQKRTKVLQGPPISEKVENLDEDFNVLKDIISDSLVNEFAERFFVKGPSILPIIDKKSYSDSYSNGTIEPLLVCAICLFEVWILPPTHPIYEKHNVNRNVLLKSLSSKENELLRTEMLNASIGNIQALLILCHQPSYTTTVNNSSLKIGLAVRMCLDLGLHKSLDTIPYSKKASEIGKRLWYSAYTMDRWACSVFGRPLAIADADFHLELPYHPKLQKYILNKSIQHEKNNDNQQTKDDDEEKNDSDDFDDGKDDMENFYFILFIKLSAILGEVQRRIYSPRAKSKLNTSHTTSYIVHSLQSLLLEWYNQVPPFARVTLEDVANLQLVTEEEKLAILRTTRWQIGSHLMLCYCAVTIILHRPFIISENESLYNPDSAKLCTEAAMMGVEIGKHLSSASYLRFGYNIATFALTVCVFIHAYNCSSSEDRDLVETSREYLKHSMDCYNKVEDIPTAVGIRAHLYALIPLLGIKDIIPTEAPVSPSINNNNNSKEKSTLSTEAKSKATKVPGLKDKEKDQITVEINTKPSQSPAPSASASETVTLKKTNDPLSEPLTQLQYMQRVLFSPANAVPFVNINDSNNNNNNNNNNNKNGISKLAADNATSSTMSSELNESLLLSSIALTSNPQQSFSQDAWQQFFLNNINNPHTTEFCSNFDQGSFGLFNTQS